MKIYLTPLFLLILITSCSLSATQEQDLNKQTGIYLDAIEKSASLLVVAKTHPAFVKYAREKGNDYFKTVFDTSEEVDVVFSNPIIKQVKENDKGEIHVLFDVEKQYIIEGENKNTTLKLVAISEDDGKTWFFLDYPMYKNKRICKSIPRILMN